MIKKDPGPIILLGILILLTGCLGSSNPGLGERHKPSGKNSSFSYTGDSFPEYLTSTRKMIADNRADESELDQDSIVNGNAPFELEPAGHCKGKQGTGRRGILLLHGLTDSPYSVHTLGNFFADQCFHVMAILLPGHGTRPGDLLNITWQEWVKSVAFGLDSLEKETDRIYILGFSTGGTLGIYQAMTDARIKGLFLFSPAVAVTPAARFSCWVDWLGTFFTRLRWLDVQPDENFYKYESFAANAACQVFKLTKEIEDTLGKQAIKLPVFIAASEDDSTVVAQATIDFFANVKNSRKSMLLYSTTKPTVAEKVLVVESANPAKNIISSSHVAITLPASDPYYGEDGKYAFCAHYYEEPDKYQQCKSGNNILLGEPTAENKKMGVVRRLTYNPDYDGMMKNLKKFIKELP